MYDQNVKWTQLAPHYRYAMTHDDKILVVQLTGVDWASVDAFINHCLELRHTWPEDKPMRGLVDQRSVNLNTPYFRKSIQRLFLLKQDRMCYTAFLLDKSIASRTLEAAVRLQMKQTHTVFKICYSFDESMAWLLQQG